MINKLKNAIFVLLPTPVRRFGQQIKRYYRKKRLDKRRENNQIVTKDNLIRDLKAIGVKTGDSLMVHSSLSKTGYVEGGAATVIEALRETIGETGTLILPSFPGNMPSKYYLEANPVFDIRNTPSAMGAVTECFRKMKGVKRSFHPTDPVCAIGPLAEYFTRDHFGQLTPYNRSSPFYKLCEKNGKSIMIGTQLIPTVWHVIEEEIENFKFPIYDAKVFEVRMTDEQGAIHIMKTKVHDPKYSKKRRHDDLIPMLEKEGVLKKGKIGEADSMLVDFRGVLEVMIKKYHEKGITIYTPYGS